MIDHARINNTLGKMAFYLSNHESISVSVSGGSDSDVIVHMICTNFREYLPKIHFVFANTGLEYQATLSHLGYLENRYGITINRVRGCQSRQLRKNTAFRLYQKKHRTTWVGCKTTGLSGKTEISKLLLRSTENAVLRYDGGAMTGGKNPDLISVATRG